MQRSLCRLITFLITFASALIISNGLSVNDVSAAFTEVTASSGLGTVGLSFANPMWIDFNNDNNLDLFIHHHGVAPSLYVNNGTGQFTDIIKSSGITPLNGIDRHGTAWGDYDNDGYIDMFITDGGCRGNCVGNKTDELWKGNGLGMFTNVTASAGVINANGRGRSAAWIDYDNDGWLDIFILNFETNSVLYRNNRNGAFSDVTVSAGLSNINGKNSSWTDYNRDGTMDLLVTGKANDRLFKNDPITHIFSDVTTQSGLLPKRGFGISWGDYNNDGFPDLFVSRGKEEHANALVWDPSKIIFKDEENKGDGIDFITSGTHVTFDLFINNKYQTQKIYLGEGKVSPASLPFTISVTDPLLNGVPAYTVAADTGYYIWRDTSGVLHLRYSGNGSLLVYYGRITSNGSFTSVTPTFIPAGNKFRDTLYKNNGNGTFTDVTSLANVGKTGNHLTSVWGDFNNDGLLDLYVSDAGDITGGRPNTLYKNNGTGKFSNNAVYQGVDVTNISARHYGAAWGDYNNDGFLDLMLKNGVGSNYPLGKGPDILFKNNGNTNHWLKLKLTGTQSNRSAIGATLTLNINGQIQYREQNGGGGGELHSQGNGTVHFGTGSATIINSLIIRWPSGRSSILLNIPSDQTIEVIE